MNLEVFEKTANSRLTRRKIVTTGTKLAYAAPLVAASFSISSLRAAAIVDTCDDLSPKWVNGVQYTCKTDASGFGCDVRESNDDGDGEDKPQGSAQVYVGESVNGPYCYCQSGPPDHSKPGCFIDQPDGSTAQFYKDDVVTVCQPVPLPDFCGVDSVSQPI